ncbi:hypothetical protein FJZ21_01115 [Candidatus Pacearchaeota archaeon]|nr:hypothetical protein [Candidatus Pacearchaeota archaeon]
MVDYEASLGSYRLHPVVELIFKNDERKTPSTLQERRESHQIATFRWGLAMAYLDEVNEGVERLLEYIMLENKKSHR